MLVLLAVAFVAGIVTALSPCVLPVLPVMLAGGTTGNERQPYAIVAGLVVSFTVFTLTATALLSALHLPDDLLRNIAIVVVALVGLSLLWPRLGDLLERPFARLCRRSNRDVGGGFLLGITLGLVFVPCAGPVIGAVATVAATERLSFDAVLVTLAYALGAGLVLLGIAIAGRRGLELPRLRRHAPTIRRVLGAAVLAVAVLMAFNLDTRLQTNLPEYTRALQKLENSNDVKSRLDGLVPGREEVVAEKDGLGDGGAAPEFTGIEGWINSEPLTLEGLRGKVVLIDFWTYSCINCLRTLPYLKQWDETYRDKGLTIVGVHTPEFAFERERSNVEGAVKRLGLEYPVALDPDFGTWEAWSNRYWPAKYLIDRTGRIRFAHFGEGEYDKTESAIRTLLAEPDLPGMVSGDVDAEAPGDVQTPETYLGAERLQGYYGSPITANRQTEYTFAETLPQNGVSYAGSWTVQGERIVAGPDAKLRLRYSASNANLVLGTEGTPGTVEVLLDGKPVKTVTVKEDDLYRLTDLPRPASTCSSSASRPASRPTPSRSASESSRSAWPAWRRCCRPCRSRGRGTCGNPSPAAGTSARAARLKAPPSSRHLNVEPASADLNRNVAVREIVVFAGPAVIVVFGLTVSTVQAREPIGEVLPTGSLARTWNVWAPWMSEAKDGRDAWRERGSVAPALEGHAALGIREGKARGGRGGEAGRP